MPINYKKTVAVFDGNCEIEEAETLLEWLLNNHKGKLNLKQLVHPHTAVLQIMIMLQPNISAWPDDETVTNWLQPLFVDKQ